MFYTPVQFFSDVHMVPHVLRLSSVPHVLRFSSVPHVLRFFSFPHILRFFSFSHVLRFFIVPHVLRFFMSVLLVSLVSLVVLTVCPLHGWSVRHIVCELERSSSQSGRQISPIGSSLLNRS